VHLWTWPHRSATKQYCQPRASSRGTKEEGGCLLKKNKIRAWKIDVKHALPKKTMKKSSCLEAIAS